MTTRRGVLFAVALAAGLASIAAPAGAKGLGSSTAPGAPTITSVTPGHKSLIVAFTPPAGSGGTPILGYRARCRPSKGGETKWSTAHKSPIHVLSVADGKSYSCVVAARNRVGFGPASAPLKFTVSGTNCTSGSGTATFVPALPTLASKVFVKTALTMHGVVGGCTGGGVTSGTTNAVSARSKGSNCTTLATDTKTPLLASPTTLTITWNTKATSTVALNIHLKTTTLQISVAGKVTAGLFKGMRLSAEADFRIPARGCTTAALSTLTYTQPTAWAIS